MDRFARESFELYYKFHQEDALRNSLYKEFHALKFSVKCPVEGFNSAFNELLNRLTVLGVIIDPKDVSN